MIATVDSGDARHLYRWALPQATEIKCPMIGASSSAHRSGSRLASASLILYLMRWHSVTLGRKHPPGPPVPVIEPALRLQSPQGSWLHQGCGFR